MYMILDLQVMGQVIGTYIEPVTGQVRFYYDDVDAIRKYNYIYDEINLDFDRFWANNRVRCVRKNLKIYVKFVKKLN